MTAAAASPRGHLAYRQAELHGGPLNGYTARIYRARGGHEPAVITLAYGSRWPDWAPARWLDYTRADDGTYHHQETP